MKRALLMIVGVVVHLTGLAMIAAILSIPLLLFMWVYYETMTY